MHRMAEETSDADLIDPVHVPQWCGSSPEDDWSGLSSAAERRRLQNRLNQRAHRKRKEKSVSQSPPSTLKPSRSCISRDRYVKIKPAKVKSHPGSSLQDAKNIDDLWPSFHSAAGSSKLNRRALAHTAALCHLTTTPQTIISHFETWVSKTYCKTSPLADHVLTLVKFNVFRAMLSNSLTLGFPAEERMDDNALSPFPLPGSSFTATSFKLPHSLRPTKLQCQISHHPWIDLLPIPGMRDNLLQAGDSYDDLELCADLVGFFNAPVVRTGLMVWGEPWDQGAWEVTEAFLGRWGWTVRGCEELVSSTNFWREKRGEESLDFGRILCEEVG